MTRSDILESATDFMNMQTQPSEMFMSFFKTTASAAGHATASAMGQPTVRPIPIVPLQDQETIKMLLH